MTQVAILGAGFAGLSSGWLLKQRGIDFHVYEKLNYPGGLARSFKWNDFNCDFAAHRLFTTDENVLHELLKLVPMGRHIRRSKIYLRGHWLRDPLDVLELGTHLSLKEKTNVSLSYLLRPRNEPENSFEQYVLKRYGKGLYDYFFKPYTEKLFGIPGEEISVLWARQKVRLANPLDNLRENLNGLVVKKTGLSFVLYKLTGIGGPWAQDPPHYANVTYFESSPELTISSTLIDDWHGWRHQRTIYFYPQGVAVIFDDALGVKKNHPAALTWHLVGRQILNGNRVLLGQNPKKGESPEVILLPISSSQPKFHSLQSDGEQPLIQAVYNASSSASLQTATIFLFDDWVGGQAQIRDQILTIKQDTRNIAIDLTEVFNE